MIFILSQTILRLKVTQRSDLKTADRQIRMEQQDEERCSVSEMLAQGEKEPSMREPLWSTRHPTTEEKGSVEDVVGR